MVFPGFEGHGAGGIGEGDFAVGFAGFGVFFGEGGEVGVDFGRERGFSGFLAELGDAEAGHGGVLGGCGLIPRIWSGNTLEEHAIG